MTKKTTLEDIIGIEHTKLGFFGEVKNKVNELQAANLKLDRKRRQLQAILEGISDAMVVMSLNFKIISVNHIFSDMFGFERPQGRTCYDLLKNRKKPCPDCPVITAKKTGKVCRKTVTYLRNEEKRRFELSVTPMTDSNNKIFRFLVFMRDVTREKEFQEKYYYSRKMATVGLLAAGVAHEINNPLTSIGGFSEGIKRRLSNLDRSLPPSRENQELMEDFNEYIDIIITECNRCRDIVKNLLTFSPRKKVDFVQVNLKNLVVDVLKLLEYRLKQNPKVNIRLCFDTKAPIVLGCAAELKQVLLNIICNAIDAIGKEGQIDISTGRLDHFVTLSVEDNGCGIATKDLDRIFDPFFTTKPIGSGTGIGLSTCYNIIQQHNGEIFFSSRESKGAVFTVKLPIPQGDPE